MEKALLNVTRFNSADVIATSGEPTPSPSPSVEPETCSHTIHYKITNSIGSGTSWTVDRYDPDAGKWVSWTSAISKDDCPSDAGIGSILGNNGPEYEYCTVIKP